MLEILGWVNGITSIIVFCYSAIVGTLLIRKSYKYKPTLLFHLGLFIFCVGLSFLGPICDFLSIIFTNNNIADSGVLYIVLNGVYIAPTLVVGVYIFSKLLFPSKVKLFLSLYSIILVIVEILFLFFPYYSAVVIYPENSGEQLLELTIIAGSPLFYFTLFFILTELIFFGFGFLYKGVKSSGIIKKKFYSLSLGFIIIVFSGLLDSFIGSLEIGIIFGRLLVGASIFLWYRGLRVESLIPELLGSPTKPYPELKLSLLEILSYSRFSGVDETEISVTKEKLVCLVCKNKIEGFSNVFICKTCKVLYCEKCVQILSDLENMCWVCNSPFDASKPTKLHTKEDKEDSIKIVSDRKE